MRRRIDRSRQESTGVEFARAERSARGQRLRGGSESTLGRPGVRGRVREGPRTNGKSKCSETRPMGAGRKCAEESAAFEGKARSAAKPAARTRTNRIGRALRVAMPSAERFNTFKSHPSSNFQSANSGRRSVNAIICSKPFKMDWNRYGIVLQEALEVACRPRYDSHRLARGYRHCPCHGFQDVQRRICRSWRP